MRIVDTVHQKLEVGQQNPSMNNANICGPIYTVRALVLSYSPAGVYLSVTSIPGGVIEWP